MSLCLHYAPTGQTIPSAPAHVDFIEQTGNTSRIVFQFENNGSTRKQIGEILQQALFFDNFVPTGIKKPFTETITDEETIQNIMRALVANKSGGFAFCEGKNFTPLQVLAARLDVDDALPLHWWMQDPAGGLPCSMEIESYNSIYTFQIEKCQWLDHMLRMSLPSTLIRQRVRLTRRIEPSDISIGISFRHPCFEDHRINRKVINLSQYGFAFATLLSEDLVYPGLEIPAIVVSAGERSTLLQGVVRHVSISKQTNRQICGVEIIPQSPFHSRLGWAHILEPRLHPTTQRGSARTVPEIWELLDRSGYFTLSGKNPGSFESLREAYTQVSDNYSRCPAMGCQVLWNSAYRLESTISISLMYSRTWLLYQLARRKGRGPVTVPARQLIRDAYIHAFEHAQWYPSLEWVLAYTEASVRWHHVTHQAFAERHEKSGKVLNLPFRLMEDHSNRADKNESCRFDISEATTQELELFIEHTRSIYPPAVRDALDFVPSRFYLQDINRTLDRADLSRERHLFVARRAGEPLAAALYETGTKGMHLFLLCDGVRLFSLSENADDAITALMEHARHFYAARDKDSFIYYLQPSQVDLGRKAGLADLGAGYMWLVHVSLIGDFMEHIHRLTAPRNLPPAMGPNPEKDTG